MKTRSLLAAALVAALFPLASVQGQSDEPTAAVDVAPAEASAETVEASAEDPPEPPEFPAAGHLWARFSPGAFRVLRTVTETFNPDGSLLGSSVTTKHEVLKTIADDAYVLDIKATVDLEGKLIEGDWQTRVLKLATDSVGRITESTTLDDEELIVNGSPVACRVWEFRYADDSETKRLRLRFNPDRFPFVLQRVERTESPEGEEESEDLERMDVVALPSAHMVNGRVVSGCHVRWVRRTGKGRTTRLAFLCESVPGGEVASSSTDVDPEGRRVRHSVTELIDYGRGEEPTVPPAGSDD